ncbi:TPA: hypothetical protein ACGO7F_002031, partial [Streptococcus suis]
ELESSFIRGRRTGKAEGLAEGLAEGRLEGRLEVAQRLLNRGLGIEDVLEITGLTSEQLAQLSQDHQF